MSGLKINVGPGELVDRLSILCLKADRIVDPDKLANVRAELAEVERVYREVEWLWAVSEMALELAAINAVLWDAEAEVRSLDRAGDDGPRFVEVARLIRRENDRRAEVKRRINVAMGSTLAEVKSHAPAGDRQS